MNIMVFLAIENEATFSIALVRAPFALTRGRGATGFLRLKLYHA